MGKIQDILSHKIKVQRIRTIKTYFLDTIQSNYTIRAEESNKLTLLKHLRTTHGQQKHNHGN